MADGGVGRGRPGGGCRGGAGARRRGDPDGTSHSRESAVVFAWHRSGRGAVRGEVRLVGRGCDRVDRELRVLPLLRELARSISVPEIVFSSRDPLLFVSRYVPGVPAGSPYADDTTRSTIPVQLAEVLATLHDPMLKDLLKSHGVVMGETQPQAATTTLRARFVGPIIVGPRAKRVLTWCDWIDDIESRTAPETTVVHGDLHPHNMVISEDGERLLLVADFENVAVGDPHYDFRYLAWFNACREAYQRLSGRQLSVERILAWHILTALGDALWRTELGVPLPGDLTPEDYVDDITRRLGELGVTIT